MNQRHVCFSKQPTKFRRALQVANRSGLIFEHRLQIFLRLATQMPLLVPLVNFLLDLLQPRLMRWTLPVFTGEFQNHFRHGEKFTTYECDLECVAQFRDAKTVEGLEVKRLDFRQ